MRCLCLQQRQEEDRQPGGDSFSWHNSVDFCRGCIAMAEVAPCRPLVFQVANAPCRRRHTKLYQSTFWTDLPLVVLCERRFDAFYKEVGRSSTLKMYLFCFFLYILSTSRLRAPPPFYSSKSGLPLALIVCHVSPGTSFFKISTSNLSSALTLKVALVIFPANLVK